MIYIKIATENCGYMAANPTANRHYGGNEGTFIVSRAAGNHRVKETGWSTIYTDQVYLKFFYRF